jgi:hypothetical protein
MNAQEDRLKTSSHAGRERGEGGERKKGKGGKKKKNSIVHDGEEKKPANAESFPRPPFPFAPSPFFFCFEPWPTWDR